MGRVEKDGSERSRRGPYRVGAVSFLNAKPLIDGLDELERIRLHLAVPSALPRLLETGQVDVALVPSIDMGRNRRRWQLVCDACIGSDGPSMTVRVFCRVRPERVGLLEVDGDSHTSVALARLVWPRLYGRTVEVRPVDGRGRWLSRCQAVLLIGDKVVDEAMRQFEFQIDLGASWKQLTGLPFVFAVWAGWRGAELEELAAMLSAARDRGVARVGQVARRYASQAGWPADLAERYLGQYMSYRLTRRHRRGLELFWQMAADEGLLGDAGHSAAAAGA